MANPPPAPPAAAEDEKRPLPPMKLKLLFPYAVNRVYGGMGRTWGVAMIGIHVLMCVVRVVSFTTDPEEALFWIPIFRVMLYISFAVIVFMACWNIVYYMPKYGLYAMEFDPPPQQPAAAAAAVQLPPPPPEIDMC